MNTVKKALLALILMMMPILTSGCWNYREVDQMSIVAGVAIDKGEYNNLKITVEIVEMGGTRDSQIRPRTITMEGKTIFDSARNIISLAGKRLYWSHTKVVIISKDLAQDGVTQVLDWFNRDAETRADINILVSKGDSAKEILTGETMSEKVWSFELEHIMKNERSLSKSPQTQIWEFANSLNLKGSGIVVPAVSLERADDFISPRVAGSAIFEGDRLAGFLSEEETKDLLFITNQVKGGLVISEVKKGIMISLEIFKNKTKTVPKVDGNTITMNISTETIVAIDEIGGMENVIEDPGLENLEKNSEKLIKTRIENFIKKIQSQYGFDIFGFGTKLRENNYRVWKNIDNNWENKFKEVKVNVKTKVHFKNSAMLSEPLKAGE